MKSIILVTYKGSQWINECLNSLKDCEYPINIVINPKGKCAYDAEGFYYAKRHDIKEFVIIHDSMIFKDVSLFDRLFELDGNVAVGRRAQMCFGKFVLDQLPPLPTKPTDKKSAISFETNYVTQIPFKHNVLPKFIDGDVFIEKHGKKRMVLENSYLTKYKGTWNPAMVTEWM